VGLGFGTITVLRLPTRYFPVDALSITPHAERARRYYAARSP